MDKNARVQSCTYATRRDTHTRPCILTEGSPIPFSLSFTLSLFHTHTHTHTLTFSLLPLSLSLFFIRHLVSTEGFETVRISASTILDLVNHGEADLIGDSRQLRSLVSLPSFHGIKIWASRRSCTDFNPRSWHSDRRSISLISRLIPHADRLYRIRFRNRASQYAYCKKSIDVLSRGGQSVNRANRARECISRMHLPTNFTISSLRLSASFLPSFSPFLFVFFSFFTFWCCRSFDVNDRRHVSRHRRRHFGQFTISGSEFSLWSRTYGFTWFFYSHPLPIHAHTRAHAHTYARIHAVSPFVFFFFPSRRYTYAFLSGLSSLIGDRKIVQDNSDSYMRNRAK